MTETTNTTNSADIVQVIGAGFGRTGTFSLKNALNELGFGPCYHMSEVFERPQDVPLWEAAGHGEPVDWHTLLADYRAIADWPGCAFYTDLMRAYPEAKVILTVRDPDSWYESAMSTIYPSSNPPDTALAELPPEQRSVLNMIRTIIWQNTFNGRFLEKPYALTVYKQHIAEVQQQVPPEKLLVYDVKDGWPPLCAFLSIAVPTTPFPYLNTREEFNSRPPEE